MGDLLMLLASLTWAFFTVLAKFLMKDYSSLKVTAYIMIIVVSFFFPSCPMRRPGAGAGFLFWAGPASYTWLSREIF